MHKSLAGGVLVLIVGGFWLIRPRLIRTAVSQPLAFSPSSPEKPLPPPRLVSHPSPDHGVAAQSEQAVSASPIASPQAQTMAAQDSDSILRELATVVQNVQHSLPSSEDRRNLAGGSSEHENAVSDSPNDGPNGFLPYQLAYWSLLTPSEHFKKVSSPSPSGPLSADELGSVLESLKVFERINSTEKPDQEDAAAIHWLKAKHAAEDFLRGRLGWDRYNQLTIDSVGRVSVK